MKRDMDLIRQILLHVEARQFDQVDEPFHVPEYADDIVGFHLELLAEAGLVKTPDASNTGHNFVYFPVGITWEGYEFLDACRDERRWIDAKKLLRQCGTVSFHVMKQLLAKLACEALGIVL